jgi:predicted glycosyltransferase
MILVTAGGGRDGLTLFRRVLKALRLNDAHQFDWLLVGGPLMPAAHRAAIAQEVAGSSFARFFDAVQCLPEYLAAADVVVSMGGYNSVCEILSANRPAVIVPRLGPNSEQLLRAEALSRLGLLCMVHPMEATPERLLQEVGRALSEPLARAGRVDLGGLGAVCNEIAALVERAA